MNQAKWSYFVQKDLSEHFSTAYAEQPSNLGALFSFKTPDQAIVYEVIEGELGAIQVFDGEVSYDDASQSYRKSVEEVEYAGGVKVTKKFRRNDLYGIVQKKVRSLARRFRSAREGIGADVFNLAFGATTVADTLSLCNTAHTSDVGGSNQGNSGITAFSAVAVEATRRLFVAFKDNVDNIIDGHDPDLLIVPTALAEAAYELISSSGKVDTANNNVNYHKGKYELLVWNNRLTDANNWFFAKKSAMKENLSFYNWNDTEFMYSGEADTLTSKHAGYMSCNVSAVDWRFLYGHAVS